MRVTRNLAMVTLTAGAVVATPQLGLACSFHDGGPVCEAFWKTPVVFVDVSTRSRRFEQPATPPRAKARASASPKRSEGTTAREIDIVKYRTSCHFSFAHGEHWVVYAFPQENGDLG